MTGKKSLNRLEIDLVLQELNLPGSRIQEIAQPTIQELVLDLYKQGESRRLVFSFADNACRFHLFHGQLPKNRKPQRFVSFLRAHIRNAHIVSAVHVNQDRILKLEIRRGENTVHFWVRMWTNAPNIIVTDAQHVILDAMFRRPKRNEISGKLFTPEGSPPSAQKSDKEFSIREIPGEGSFQERLEIFFASEEKANELETLRELLQKQLIAKESKLAASKKKIEKSLEESGEYQRFREIGDLIISNMSMIQPGDRWLTCEDYYHDKQPVEIELEVNKSGIENAEQYYEKYKKSRNRHQYLTEELKTVEKDCEETRMMLEKVEQTNDLHFLQETDKKLRTSLPPKQTDDKTSPGKTYQSAGFTIIVGKTAKENEALLRRHVRGNDYWLHVRDTAGAYVFIKNKPGKTIPLEVLLDAGNLAVFFSKAKSSGKADLYYTQVKYLKKIKGAKAGLVLATQEKNIAVTLDETRLHRLFNG
ncbi:MAG: NFACT family protein [Spirochaetales bacterium]|nr:NFACT family protein [Spirochaetales bacterium]